MKTITIFCPVYNEAENVIQFHRTFSDLIAPLCDRYSFRFLFADNRSTDGTFAILSDLATRNPDVGILRYSRNFGAMKSIYTGLLRASGDAVAVFDCDLQDPPELLLDFIREWEGGAKIVFGQRKKRDEPLLITVLRKAFRGLERRLQKQPIEIESGAWLLDRRITDELRRRNRFEPYLAGLLSRLGFAAKGISYDRRRRLRGKSKFDLLSYFAYASDGVVSGTILPLRLSIVLGVAISFFSFLSMVYFVIAKFFLGASFAAGVAAAIIITLFSFGTNLIFLGILGEYVGRIYQMGDTDEPAIVDDTINLPV